MCHKAAETTLHTNNIFDPGTASKRSVQWKFKMFCKEDKSLENEKYSGWPSEVDSDHLKTIIEAVPLETPMRSC